jgi:hypothetical protein
MRRGSENNVDLFSVDRMRTISEGVTSLLEGREPLRPPSRIISFLVYAVLFSVIALQSRGIIRSVVALRPERLPAGRVGPWWSIGLSPAVSLAWALLVLVLLPRQFGVSLRMLAQGFPDFAYILTGNAVVALAWGPFRAIWAYSMLRKVRRSEGAAHVATT